MMRRGANGEMRSANDALETINAAATAIASAENRASQGSVQVQKRRWGNCFSIYWCFGSQKQNKRIGHAVYDPTETTAPGEDRLHSVDNSARTTTSIMLPFVAPPSSPASFLQSEPPSATQSPSGVISFSSMSANMYSPGPASMFAIGPYAHETQLVSPPVFSTFTTEPSTAPFTPPPESVHLTTPSSPEVPFAKLLDPNHQNMFPSYPHEFQSYQLQPGSPISRLLSPGSAISGSGTSSPFPDREFGVGDPYFLEFRTGDPPKLLNLEKIAPHEWGSGSGSRQRSGTLTPERLGTRSHDNFKINHQSSDATPLSNPYNRWKNDETVLNHRVSFEVTAEDFLRCMEKKPGLLSKSGFAASLEKEKSTAKEQECPPEIKFAHESYTVDESSGESSKRASGDGEDRNRHHNNQSITLGSSEEFNFDHVNDELSDKPIVAGSDWWANEKDLGQGSGPCQKWSFFPMMQPGIR